MVAKTTAKKSTKFSEEQYLNWYRSMLMMRKFEEKVGQLYGQQKIKGFCHLYIGQEACATGSVSALTKDDKFITAYRDHGYPLALGTNPDHVMAELFGKATGVSKGKGGSMHMFDKGRNFMGGYGIVGGQIPLGAGIGFAEQYLGTKNVCVCFMGDGAVRQGAFHEALNMAMTMKMPTIFAVENNGYAMGTSVKRASNVTDLYRLSDAYLMPAKAVDAMKVEEVHNAIKEAADCARKGDGPTFLEFRTYRYKGHSMSDPAKYRSKDELEEYKQQDPIEQVKQTILKNNWVGEDELKKIDTEIKERIMQSVQFAEESPWPDPSEAYTDNYVENNYPFVTS